MNSKINKRLKDALFTDQWSELFMDVLSPFHFVLVRQSQRGWTAGVPSVPASQAGGHGEGGRAERDGGCAGEDLAREMPCSPLSSVWKLN